MRSHNVLLVVGVIFFACSAYYFVLQAKDTLFAQPLNAGVAEVGVDNTAVLGVETGVPCISQEEFTREIIRLRPRIVMFMDSDRIELATKRFQSCVTISTTNVKGYTCPVYKTEVNSACAEELLRTEVTFPLPNEIIGSPRYGVQVESRISDSVPDYALLAERIIAVYQGYTQYTTIVSKNVTIKDVVVEVPSDTSVPNTKGTFAERYIEVDGSRQLVFVWDGGTFRTYQMSGAYSEFNPVGIHKILNKSPNAWSSTALKWMPYWMAFAADPKQKSMLGFHSLVYWYPGYAQTGGSKIWEPETNIGIPRSTGCMRLRLDQAKELYGWARVGDWVVIHN